MDSPAISSTSRPDIQSGDRGLEFPGPYPPAELLDVAILCVGALVGRLDDAGPRAMSMAIRPAEGTGIAGVAEFETGYVDLLHALAEG